MQEPAERQTHTDRRIAIVGKAPSSRLLAPYDDESWEIWTLSDLIPRGQATRCTAHFEFHPVEWFREREAQGDDYLHWMRSIRGIPVYMAEPIAEIPEARPFPIQDVLKHFAPHRYFTNTVSYLIALAIMREPVEVGVWGVDMAQNKEYRNQRPSCEWLLGWAQGAGIRVTLPPECDLMKAPFLYGYGHQGNEMRKKWEARSDELKTRIGNKTRKMQEAQQQAAQFETEIHALHGALDSQSYYEQWTFDYGSEPDGSQH